jgi:hypothetical protein
MSVTVFARTRHEAIPESTEQNQSFTSHSASVTFYHPNLYHILIALLTVSVLTHADHSGRAVYGMKCLRSLEHWDRGFESHSRHGCLSAFILCSFCR